MLETSLVAVALAVGWFLRTLLPSLARLRIPAALLGGLLGLAVFEVVRRSGWLAESTATDGAASLSAAVENLRQWPAFLIAVVFGGLLLVPQPSQAANQVSQLSGPRWWRVAQEGLMVWIIVLGQTAIGMLVVWLVIQPSYDVPNAAGMLIETGFAGGHGTAAAMGSVFRDRRVGFPEGYDLGVLMATAGLAYGLLSGIVWVNLGIRLRWHEPAGSVSNSAIAAESAGPPPQPARHREQAADARTMTDTTLADTTMGRPRCRGDNVDPLLLQMLWLGLAVALGGLLQQLTIRFGVALDTWFAWGEAAPGTGEAVGAAAMIASFPLFIYTLFGGLLVRYGLTLAGGQDRLDGNTISRLVSASMDVLVVTAVATMDLQTVAALWVPFLALFVAGAFWSAVCLLFLGRWILPRDRWFTLGLINYGMSTGTTATGFVLLRLVDPELRSGAGEDYALAAPLSSPFIGGGLLTISLPILFLQRTHAGIAAVTLASVVAVLVAIAVIARRKRFGGQGVQD